MPRAQMQQLFTRALARWGSVTRRAHSHCMYNNTPARAQFSAAAARVAASSRHHAACIGHRRTLFHRATPRAAASGGDDEGAGLYGFSELAEPDGWSVLAKGAIAESDRLVERLIALADGSGACADGAADTETKIEALHTVDGISNAICSVMDVGEFCRQSHADAAFRAAADACFFELHHYMQTLNTDTRIYGAMRRVLGPDAHLEDRVGGGGKEEQERHRMGAALLREFERDGIHLDEAGRGRVRELKGDIERLGTTFLNTITAAQQGDQAGEPRFVDVPADVVRSLDTNVQEFLRALAEQGQPRRSMFSFPGGGGGGGGGVRLPATPQAVQTVMRYVPHGPTRRAMYEAGHTMAPDNLDVLRRLVKQRGVLAHTLGFASYGQLATQESLLAGGSSKAAAAVGAAGTAGGASPVGADVPKAVSAFLESFVRRLRPKAEAELAELRAAKREVEGDAGDGVIHAWDLPFYTDLVKSRALTFDASAFSAYFPLDRCVDGLGIVTERLFGIELREASLAPGESWAGAVGGSGSTRVAGAGGELRKLELVHETEGVLGHIFLDLYPREGKHTHSAHFTLRCGKTLDRATGARQLPVVTLVFNFPPPSGGAMAGLGGRPTPTLLQPAAVETLFHEFGHALHSLLSTTEFQHLSGTRVSQDFVEVPSHLWEYFVWDRRVAKLFARHYKTGEVIPDAILDTFLRSKQYFAALEAQSQAMYALFDMHLYSAPDASAVDSVALFERLHNEHTLIPFPRGTHWHSTFGHLVHYGAGYYSYLLARVIAAGLWHRCFARDPLSRDAGEQLRRELLSMGNAQDPQCMLESLLGSEYGLGGGAALQKIQDGYMDEVYGGEEASFSVNSRSAAY